MARSTVSSARRRTTRPRASARRRRRSRSSTPSSPRARRSFSRRALTLHGTRCPVPRPGSRGPSDATRTLMRIQRRRPNSSSSRPGSLCSSAVRLEMIARSLAVPSLVMHRCSPQGTSF
ncbi:COMPASS-like H3K4 histone methylase component WDR5B [Zea mays]|uniref:COMPASS-like H3K4 histone methylase component WDR5B n=1 Tax=Zea mays TaxID=4577 RepID=A0A1D6K3B7_MAIZE|nr:COMPASS-like H3K4 histone methylase component WDR5B [Zea mays]